MLFKECSKCKTMNFVEIHHILYAFGSVLTDRFSEQSDLDFFVVMPAKLDPLEKGENLLTLWFALEQIFDRKIDLLTDTSVKNPYLQAEILAHKTLLYGQQKMIHKNQETYSKYRH